MHNYPYNANEINEKKCAGNGWECQDMESGGKGSKLIYSNESTCSFQ